MRREETSIIIQGACNAPFNKGVTMAEQLTNYQCPNCNGPLTFDPKIQKLKCDNCGSTFTTDDIDKYFYEQNKEAASLDTNQQKSAAETLQWSQEEAQQLRAYNCPSCGAQLITDSTTAATSCPYCGNPTIVPSQFEGSLKPDYIIPFKLVKDDAINQLKEFYKGKPLLPKAFTSKNHIQEIKGVYVPFWLYDGIAEAHIRAHATRVSTFQTRDEIVTTTDHFRVERDGTVDFKMVPADASSKMPDDFMDSIEPFDYSELVPFQMSYLPGYLADKYDVSSEDDANRVDFRVKNSALQLINESIMAYATCIPEKENVQIFPQNVHYAFLPVWMLSTQYNGKNYLFAMNGQSGKMIGDDLPVDNAKMIGIFFAITLGGIALLFLIIFVIAGGSL